VTIALSGLLPERKSQVSIGLTRKTGNQLKQQSIPKLARSSRGMTWCAAMRSQRASMPAWSQAFA